MHAHGAHLQELGKDGEEDGWSSDSTLSEDSDEEEVEEEEEEEEVETKKLGTNWRDALNVSLPHHKLRTSKLTSLTCQRVCTCAQEDGESDEEPQEAAPEPQKGPKRSRMKLFFHGLLPSAGDKHCVMRALSSLR